MASNSFGRVLEQEVPEHGLAQPAQPGQFVDLAAVHFEVRQQVQSLALVFDRVGQLPFLPRNHGDEFGLTAIEDFSNSSFRSLRIGRVPTTVKEEHAFIQML